MIETVEIQGIMCHLAWINLGKFGLLQIGWHSQACEGWSNGQLARADCGRGCFFLTLWLSPFTLFLLGDLKGDWCV